MRPRISLRAEAQRGRAWTASMAETTGVTTDPDVINNQSQVVGEFTFVDTDGNVISHAF